jgi:outer membrane protein assembly factor BamD (BamD/ComL family)
MNNQRLRRYFWFATLLGSVCISGCTSITGGPDTPLLDAKKLNGPFEQSNALFYRGQYEAAYNENQKILQEGRGAPDVALFNMGMISAHSANPKKNYPRALSSFRTLIAEYPQSPLIEPAKTWIQVLEEYQKLADEKRVLMREREAFVHEKDKLKYTVEKSQQVDVDIEKRRRDALRK